MIKTSREPEIIEKGLKDKDQMRQISDDLGIPCVMIDVDHADERKYSEEIAFNRLETLLEVIDAKRAGGSS